MREGDHREHEDHKGRKRSKVAWALEATIVTMARGPGETPQHPNLALGLVLARPGEDPGGVGVRVLASLVARGYKPGFLGADRGYTQVAPEHFHLPVRALGYSLVMDYKENDLGRQANSGGAVLVDGCFYCPAMPEPLVSATGDRRAATINEVTFTARIAGALGLSPRAQVRDRTKTATSGSHVRPSVATRTSSVRSGQHRPQPSARYPCSLLRAASEGLHPAGDHDRCRPRSTPPPGAGVRDRALGTGLCHLPQHDRGLERLCERRRPRVPRSTFTPAGAGHRRTERLLCLLAHGCQHPQDPRLIASSSQTSAPARSPNGPAVGE